MVYLEVNCHGITGAEPNTVIRWITVYLERATEVEKQGAGVGSENGGADGVRSHYPFFYSSVSIGLPTNGRNQEWAVGQLTQDRKSAGSQDLRF